MVHDNKQYLINFFTDAVEDPARIKRDILSKNSVDVTFHDNTLSFTLHGLYQYLFLERSCSYAEFKQLLYNSELNTVLAATGAKVLVKHSTGKIDTNTYYLER